MLFRHFAFLYTIVSALFASGYNAENSVDFQALENDQDRRYNENSDSAPIKLRGINYSSRGGPDWALEQEKCKSTEVIAKELKQIRRFTNRIRIFSLSDCNQCSKVVPLALEAGFKIQLGLWIGKDNENFDVEKEHLVKLIRELGDKFIGKHIAGIHVGSEAIYRKDIDVKTAIQNLHDVRGILDEYQRNDIPLTIADIGDIYIENPELIQAVDYVSANSFPFWEKIPYQMSVKYFYFRYKELEKLAYKARKAVVIGETGWPTDGKADDGGEASPKAAARFFTDFLRLTEIKDINYYYFTAFDDSWKLAGGEKNNTVEGHFGILNEDGNLKYELLNAVNQKILHKKHSEPKHNERTEVINQLMPILKNLRKS